jgi:hypothetical protein
MVLRLPLFDEAAQTIKKIGSFQRDLTAQELADIMSGIGAGLIQEQESISASVPLLDVRIENAEGIVNGSVKVDKPIQALIRVICVLNNDTVPGRIKLAGLDIQQEAGFAARLALKAVNIEDKIREALRDPNKALRLALSSQLTPRGVLLTGLGLNFNDSILAVSLEGKPVLH